jgi:nucleotide-binding universal stress UspA family protein
MRIMMATDGSEDGLRALEQVASIGSTGKDAVVTFVVGWPPRDGPMWEAVYERQFVADDLHRALEETIEMVSERLRRIAGRVGHEVQSRVEDGDAAEQLAKAVEREHIDILIVGVTGGPARRHAQNVVDDLLPRIRIPLVVVHGTAR